MITIAVLMGISDTYIDSYMRNVTVYLMGYKKVYTYSSMLYTHCNKVYTLRMFLLL